jgi:hypothetical protein
LLRHSRVIGRVLGAGCLASRVRGSISYQI